MPGKRVDGAESPLPRFGSGCVGLTRTVRTDLRVGVVVLPSLRIDGFSHQNGP